MNSSIAGRVGSSRHTEKGHELPAPTASAARPPPCPESQSSLPPSGQMAGDTQPTHPREESVRVCVRVCMCVCVCVCVCGGGVFEQSEGWEGEGSPHWTPSQGVTPLQSGPPSPVLFLLSGAFPLLPEVFHGSPLTRGCGPKP